MFALITSVVLGFLIGLGGTWVTRKEQAYERAMLFLVLYLPLGMTAFVAGALCGWWQAGYEAVIFHGFVSWQMFLIGMLPNICTPSPPKPEVVEDEEI